MRKLVTGVNGEGRSCLIELQVVQPADSPNANGIRAAVVAQTAASPPPSRPPGQAHTKDLRLPTGLARWVVVEYAAELELAMHNTDTIDFGILLDGSATLQLDDGEHQLEVGDMLIVNGVDHAWKAGPQGCRLSVLSIGTPPLAQAEQ